MSQTWVDMDGYYRSPNLSRELRMAVSPLVRFRQFCEPLDATKAKAASGGMLGKGDQFHWNTYSQIASRGTTLVETSTMPESSFTVTQGTLTVDEAGNAVPYTGKLDDLSMHPIKEIINKVVKEDARRVFDCLAHAQFNTTPLRVVPTDGTTTDSVVLTTNGTATATNNVAMGTGHVKAIVDTMKERNIPTYDGENYGCVSHPTTLRAFKNGLESIHQYTDQGFRMILKGEIGRYENCRFFEQTSIPKGGAADSSTFNSWTDTADAWNNGKSSWAFFFGNDTVAEGIVVPEEMRGKIPTDYGRSKGIAWYYLGGFGIVHTAAAQARIVKWDSAV